MTGQVVKQWIRAQFKVRWLRVFDKTVVWTMRAFLFFAMVVAVMIFSAQVYALGYNDSTYEPYLPGAMGVGFALAIFIIWVVMELITNAFKLEETPAEKAAAAREKAERDRIKQLVKQAEGDELRLLGFYRIFRIIALIGVVAWTPLLVILSSLVISFGNVSELVSVLIGLFIAVLPFVVSAAIAMNIRKDLVARLEKRLGATPA